MPALSTWVVRPWDMTAPLCAYSKCAPMGFAGTCVLWAEPGHHGVQGIMPDIHRPGVGPGPGSCEGLHGFLSGSCDSGSDSSHWGPESSQACVQEYLKDSLGNGIPFWPVLVPVSGSEWQTREVEVRVDTGPGWGGVCVGLGWGIVWRYQTQAGGRVSSGGPEVGSWRRTNADPSVSLAFLVDAVVDNTSLRSKAHRQTSDTWEHTPGTAMHPPGAEAGTQREVGRRGENGKAGRMEEGRAEQRAQAAQNAQHSTAHSTQHTAGQAAYRRAGSAAPRQAPGAWRPSPASAFKILLFRRQRLDDLKGSLGPGPRAGPGPFSVCLPPALLFLFFPIASSKPSGPRD